MYIIHRLLRSNIGHNNVRKQFIDRCEYKRTENHILYI